jgi:hypothetical protein
MLRTEFVGVAEVTRQLQVVIAQVREHLPGQHAPVVTVLKALMANNIANGS